MLKKILSYSCSLIFIFLLWYAFALYINADLILPYPAKVFESMVSILRQKFFWITFVFTLFRVITAFIIAIVVGSLLGFLCSINSYIKDFFEIPVAIIRATPVIAVILVALFWFTSGIVPVFVAVLMNIPIITTSVIYGLSYKNEKLLFMAEIYCLSKKDIFFHIKLPELKTHFLSACNNAFGLTWKVVVAGEVLSLPKYGLGSIMNKSQVHLETADVMAITIILIIISFSLEKILQRLFRNEK